MSEEKPQETTVSKAVQYWLEQIETYEQKFSPWEKRSRKIIKRFKDERGAKSNSRFNILWSNVQTLKPALYASPPNPNIDRRFQDDDDLGRYASLTLERCTSYFVGNQLFDETMKQATLDRLLGGRGTTWVRYVPTFEEVKQITEDATAGAEDGEGEELVNEDVVPDYVHWEEFGHTWARTWQEVRGVWRKVYLDRAALVKRFGVELGNKIQLDAKPAGKNDSMSDLSKKATVYEIWDKTTKNTIWLHKDMPDLLDEVTDPLGLKDFFPCPKPIYATLTNDNLIPTPDYVLYQDQANELDELTGRISSIVKAIKIAGVYDASAQGVDRLLSEGIENKMIPVEQWAVFAEKGGLKGVFSLLPMEEIVRTLQALYEAREAVKQVIYEITGISDIIRGSSKASETATAQKLKGQYATLRLDDQQADIARFSADMVRIMAEIIAEHFSFDTIKKLSGVKLLTEEEKQDVKQQQAVIQQAQAAQQGQQQGQQPVPHAPPPIDDEVLDLLDMPSWEDVEALIRDDAARSFRIEIETDSTIKTDQESEKAARVEFLNAAGGFMQQAISMPPNVVPLAMEMLMFGVRGFKVSRELETSFETSLAKLKKAAEQPPSPPQPDPAIEIEKLKTQQHKERLQFDGQKLQQDGAIAGQQLQMEGQKIELERKKADDDVLKTRLTAKASAAPEIALMDGELNEGGSPIAMLMTQLTQMFSQGLQEIAQSQQANNNQVIAAITAPKEVIKDANGKMVGVKTIGA